MNASAEIREAIVAADRVFSDTYRRGDAAGMGSLYTESGQLMPPNSDFVTGREGIQAAFQSFMDMGVKEIKLEALEVEGYGDTATEVGKYTLEAEAGSVIDQGKYIVIWKQEAGAWQLHRDIFNSSMPAPA
ncbi:YybH family protein [Candidatus Latescibacterota bacterium]